MTLKKTLLKGILIILVGIFITALIAFLLSLTSEKHISLIPTQLIIVAIISFEFIELPILVDFKKSNILIETFIHFIISSVFFFSGALMWGLVDVKSLTFLILVLDFILIYLEIWIIQYFNLKHKIQKINQKLLEK